MADANRAVYAALAGNLAIAATKLFAATITGSSAMLAEGFHSLVDTADSALLLFGRYRARRPPDESHPFGHGQELYFWTFVVAILIFAVGGGASIYEGVMHLAHPHPPGNVTWNYLVLGLAAVFETASFVVGYSEFRGESNGRPFWQAVRRGKDPTIFTVVFEDAAALAGIVIAFVGIWMSERLHTMAFDAAASILIGFVLTAIAMLLARESKGLLVGEGLDMTTLRQICALATRDPAVEHIKRPLSMHLGPETVILAMDVQFRRGLSSEEVAAAVDRIEQAIRSEHPQIQHLFLEAESITGRPPADSRTTAQSAGSAEPTGHTHREPYRTAQREG